MHTKFELLPECPFYMDFKNNRVVCEGLDDHSTIQLAFNRPRFMEAHKKRYCCSMNYGSCPIGKLLYDKYED